MALDADERNIDVLSIKTGSSSFSTTNLKRLSLDSALRGARNNKTRAYQAAWPIGMHVNVLPTTNLTISSTLASPASMPTATTTTVAKGAISTQIPLKGVLNSPLSPAMGSPSSPTAKTSTSATLRSLYNRAGRAFVLRDIPLTYSLIQSAFALLSSPVSVPDTLADYRRKWDILRITFESTVYSSPPPATETLPESLRAVLSEPAQALVTSIYKRSLSLFTPSNGAAAQKVASNAAYLPYQVLTTLVYSSLKVDAADVGRVIIEDWLACREPRYSLDAQEGLEGEGYAKILDLYCIHILPKLEQWDYAKEFLEYENEMPELKREVCDSVHDAMYVWLTSFSLASQKFIE
jgi:hypothetical protein